MEKTIFTRHNSPARSITFMAHEKKNRRKKKNKERIFDYRTLVDWLQGLLAHIARYSLVNRSNNLTLAWPLVEEHVKISQLPLCSPL